MSEGLQNIVLLVPVFLFSLCVHEFAHAWTAVRCGDKTPQLAGRLTLHPMAHADWLGTIILPILCIYGGYPFIGWAKPVPVDVGNLKHGRRSMALVAAAGPLSNIFLAVLAAFLVFVVARLPFEHRLVESLATFTVVSIQVNIMLALFNLIPIPPLDGFMVAQGFIPGRFVKSLDYVYRYAGIILIVAIISGWFRYLSIPARYAFKFLMQLALPT